MAPSLEEPHFSSSLPAFDSVPTKQADVSDRSPLQIESPLAWYGSQYRDESTYVYTLSDEEKSEVDRALQHFLTLGLDGDQVNRDTFPLPMLRSRLEGLRNELHHGRGFFLLRGLDPKAYSVEHNTIIFLGVTAYIGELRGKQTDDGDIFAHIRNAEAMNVSQQNRPVKDSNLGADFHSDLYSDILALQARGSAEKGGRHLIASTAMIYNELMATKPALLNALVNSDWPLYLHRRLAETENRPLFFHHDNKLVSSVLPHAYLESNGVARPPGLPKLNTTQMKAHHELQALARKHHIALPMQPGDLTFVNNWAIIHTREGFEDSAEKKRYLVRLWLKNEEMAWKLPDQLQHGNRMVFYDEEVEDNWNIVPLPRRTFKPYERQAP